MIQTCCGLGTTSMKKVTNESEAKVAMFFYQTLVSCGEWPTLVSHTRHECWECCDNQSTKAFKWWVQWCWIMIVAVLCVIQFAPCSDGWNLSWTRPCMLQVQFCSSSLPKSLSRIGNQPIVTMHAGNLLTFETWICVHNIGTLCRWTVFLYLLGGGPVVCAHQCMSGYFHIRLFHKRGLWQELCFEVLSSPLYIG